MPRTPRKQKLFPSPKVVMKCVPRKLEEPTKVTSPKTPTTPKRKVQEPVSQPSTPQTPRNVGSLVILTQNFVSLMKENNGEIDLKQATEVLNVQKRRIYDITNVLEGVGLIEKSRHSSTVRWRGTLNKSEESTLISSAYARTNHLIALEDDLDIQLEYARRNLNCIKNDALNQSFAYVTRDDFINTYGDDVVLVIPKHDEEMQVRKKHNSLHLSLDNGGTIDVRLVTDKGQSSTSSLHCSSSTKKSETKTNMTHTARVELFPPSPSLSEESSSSSPSISSKLESTSISLASNKKAAQPQKHNEHTYFCSTGSESKAKGIDLDELTARIIFQSSTAGHSLRQFFPDDPNMENSPLQRLNPPQNDFNFMLLPNEGICELFDISCSS